MGYTPHVLVVGGGVVGTGIARDLAIRGLDVTLVERGTLTTGTTGQSLGVLDSGAHTASNEQLARRTYRENQILRRIASHCTESTGGLLVSDGNAGPSLDELQERLEAASIPHEMLDGDSASETEPGLRDVGRAISVPDAVVDPHELTVANARSASEHGATVRTGTAVTDITVNSGTIDTVTLEHDPTPAGGYKFAHTPSELRTDGGKPGMPGSSKSPADETDGPGTDTNETTESNGQESAVSSEEIDPDYVINAAGGWAGEVAALAGLDVDLVLTAGTTVLLSESPVETVVTRLSGGDSQIIGPRGGKAVVGTAHEEISNPDEPAVSPDRVEQLLDRLNATVHAVEDERQLRWDWGIYASHRGADDENGHVFLDHGDRDGCWGMTTVVGGSVTTHRYVAEQVVDEVCSKFGIRRECQTDGIPLPGSEQPNAGAGDDSPPEGPVVCECESVTRAEVREALADETATGTNLEEVRIRTGATMGECQGGKCAHRIANELPSGHNKPAIDDVLDAFRDHHWQGQRYALCGAQLERAMRSYIFQVETLNLVAPNVEFVQSKTEQADKALEEGQIPSTNNVNLATFDDGTDHHARERPMWGERQR